MIQLKGIAGKRFAVFGLGVSGLSTCAVLTENGAEIAVWDDTAEKRDLAAEQSYPLLDLYAENLSDYDFLVLSPGIPLTHPEPHKIVTQAKEAGCPIICDLELLNFLEPSAKLIAVTGTNGKSTTTSLLTHILNYAEMQVDMGGNIGKPLSALSSFAGDGIYVLELSSYQLDLLDTLVFDYAILLNITADHLERHGGMAGYVAAKERVLGRGKKEQFAVLNIDDENCSRIYNTVSADLTRDMMPLSVQRKLDQGISVTLDGVLCDDGREVLNLKGLPTLKGQHNWQNIAACYGIAKYFGIGAERFFAAVESYPGLEHRQEYIRKIGNVSYINDSKATNTEATEKALSAFEDIYWIAGGESKNTGYEILSPYLMNVRRAYLIGEAAYEMSSFLLKAHNVQNMLTETLEKALQYAHEDAQKSGKDAVILLSPACASFDQFKSFEERGDFFRDLVNNL
ncbi:MAG: UDP-N-acetylmuramoyl-L-alanine--D-glutamate ligase [Alphaproteobacteria bacterium]